MTTSFITITFLYFFFHNPDSLICVSDNRNAVCTQEYNPVCALYSGNDCDSPTGYCVKTVNSACDACSDASIAGYILGECPYMPVQSCSQDHSKDSCVAMDLQGTVCGIQQDPQQPDQLIKTVWDNGCEACTAGDASFYLGGETLGECIAVSTSNICQPQDRNVQNCEWSAMPACAYYTGGDCTEGVCRKTMDSYCTACADENVMFYLNGDCADLVPIGAEGSGTIIDYAVEEEDVPEEEDDSEEEYEYVDSEPIVDYAVEEEDVPEEEEDPEDEYEYVDSDPIIDYAAEEEDVPEEEYEPEPMEEEVA